MDLAGLRTQAEELLPKSEVAAPGPPQINSEEHSTPWPTHLAFGCSRRRFIQRRRAWCLPR